MSLYQGSGFWGGKQYQNLTELQLPSPAVVIDVRWGNDHDPPLIWHLAVELEDLSLEMKLNQVQRWRHLIDCIDLLKVSPLVSDKSLIERADFILTTRVGQKKPLHGVRQLTEELGREHIDRVRNNRVGANRDRNKDTINQHLALVGDAERSTVRVFFLVDAEDTDSLVSAATYAMWLKQWYHEYDDAERSGRDERISTLAICMNADPYRHRPEYLAKYLNHEQGTRSALNTVILLHTYSNDEAYIGGEIQSYQAELILYALLLRSLESMIESDHDMLDEQSLSPYLNPGALANLTVIPWAIYVMGVSSLEYSARWGNRWLDYGLVAKIIHLMRKAEDVDRESELGWLHTKAQQAIKKWLQEVREVLPVFASIIPELQALDDLERHLSSPLKSRRSSSCIQDLQAFVDPILGSYRGKGQTLEGCIAQAHLIPWQITSDSTQTSTDTLDESSSESDPYQRLLALQKGALRLPVSLLHRTHGMLNRSLQQVAELNRIIAEIRNTAENPPDLQECHDQLKQQVELEQARLLRAMSARRWHWPFTDKLLEQGQESARKLSAIAQQHLDQVREVIIARMALVLLQEVGLYNPEGKLCLYQQRLKLLDEAMKQAEVQALLQHQRAYERLKVSLSQKEVGISQSSTWLSLNSRKDLLDWVQLVKYFEHLSHNLESEPVSLLMLMKCILLLIGGEKPMIIMQQLLGKLKEEQSLFSKQDEFEQARLQVLSTILVAILLLFDIINIDVSAIEPLLESYIDMRKYSSDEPSLLENNISALQQIISETKATHSHLLSKKNVHLLANSTLRQSQPFVMILAAWVNSQYVSDPSLMRILDHSGILVRLEEHKIKAEEILDDLRERNRLLGYRDAMAGQDRFFLLLNPGEASNKFLTELDLQNSSHIRAVRFPDPEKLIYLHIHRIRRVFPDLVSSPQEQPDPQA